MAISRAERRAAREARACEVFGSDASAALVWARALDGAGLAGIHIHDYVMPATTSPR